jgi:multiple sugar transport system substrate-binding protein
MSHITRSLKIVGLCLLVTAILIPGQALAEDTVIRFVNWASAEAVTRDTINGVIAEFEEQNPGIKVENVAIPFGQIRTQIITMTAGGNAPEVMQLSGVLPFELAEMGALADLSEYADEAYINDIWEGPLKASYYKDQLINVPWAVTPFGFWYNKKLMTDAGIAEPPKTWDEFMQALDTVKEHYEGQGIDAFELFTAKALYGVVHNWSLMWAFGAFPLENDTAGFDTPEMKAYFSWMRKMIQEGYTTGGFKLREFREELAKGRLVFGFDGPYVQGMIKSLNSEITDENLNDVYGVAGLPAGVTGESLVALDFHCLAMAEQTKDKEAAWKFIKFLTASDEVIENYLLPMGAILPLKSSVEQYSEVFEQPINKAFIEQVLPATRGIPYTPEWGQAAQFILDAIQKACFTDEPIDQIAAEVDKNVSVIYGW